MKLILICLDENGYQSDGSIFTGYIYKLESPVFDFANRSEVGKGTDFKKDIVEFFGKNCYIPTSKYLFTECIIFQTQKDYKQHFLEIIRNPQRRSHAMTQARIETFCSCHNFNIGFYNGKEFFSRSIIERNKALFLYKNRFCYIKTDMGIRR